MGSNCLYYECVSAVCVAPALTCPSNVAGNKDDIPCPGFIVLYPSYSPELFTAYAIPFLVWKENAPCYKFFFLHFLHLFTFFLSVYLSKLINLSRFIVSLMSAQVLSVRRMVLVGIPIPQGIFSSHALSWILLVPLRATVVQDMAGKIVLLVLLLLLLETNSGNHLLTSPFLLRHKRQ